MKSNRKLLIERIHATIKASTPEGKESIIKDIFAIQNMSLLSREDQDACVDHLLDISCGFRPAEAKKRINDLFSATY